MSVKTVENSEAAEDLASDPAPVVKKEFDISEVFVELENQNPEKEYPSFSVKTESNCSSEFLLKREDKINEPVCSVKRENPSCEPELIIPDIVPNIFACDESEEKLATKKVRIATWSPTSN